MRIPPEYRRRKRRKPYQKKNVVAKEDSTKSEIEKKNVAKERITKTDSNTVCNSSPTSLVTNVATDDTETIDESSETNDERVLKLDLTHFKLLDIPKVSPVEPIDVHTTDNLLRTTEDCMRFLFGKCIKLLTTVKRSISHDR